MIPNGIFSRSSSRILRIGSHHRRRFHSNVLIRSFRRCAILGVLFEFRIWRSVCTGFVRLFSSSNIFENHSADDHRSCLITAQAPCLQFLPHCTSTAYCHRLSTLWVAQSFRALIRCRFACLSPLFVPVCQSVHVYPVQNNEKMQIGWTYPVIHTFIHIKYLYRSWNLQYDVQ